jgi:hypothetical protein
MQVDRLLVPAGERIAFFVAQHTGPAKHRHNRRETIVGDAAFVRFGGELWKGAWRS